MDLSQDILAPGVISGLLMPVSSVLLSVVVLQSKKLFRSVLVLTVTTLLRLLAQIQLNFWVSSSWFRNKKMMITTRLT